MPGRKYDDAAANILSIHVLQYANTPCRVKRRQCTSVTRKRRTSNDGRRARSELCEVEMVRYSTGGA
jgi:hypothetical protein